MDVNYHTVLNDLETKKGQVESAIKVLSNSDWIEVKSDADLPDEADRYLFTIENQKGERKVSLMNLRQLWSGQKVVAYRPIPAPFQKVQK